MTAIPCQSPSFLLVRSAGRGFPTLRRGFSCPESGVRPRRRVPCLQGAASGTVLEIPNGRTGFSIDSRKIQKYNLFNNSARTKTTVRRGAALYSAARADAIVTSVAEKGEFGDEKTGFASCADNDARQCERIRGRNHRRRSDRGRAAGAGLQFCSHRSRWRASPV